MRHRSPSRLPSAASIAAAVALAVPFGGCAAQATPNVANAERPTPNAERPTLVVLVTVDQMRADYLDRFAPQLTGGLARLSAGGARFTNAHHDHAIPETAPGHATLLSGRFPRSTGIYFNDAGVDDEAHPLIGGAKGDGASPRRFNGSTLIQWMQSADRRSRALSVSRKDRGAILPLGRAKEQAFWYAYDGRFITSTYYADRLPEWVQRFNERRVPQSYAGRTWDLLLPAGEYPEPDSVQIEGAGHDYTFPHRIPSDTARATAYLTRTPFMDEVVLAFALEGVRATGLGAGPQPDLLSVSLSTTDAVGHVYGPDSRETHDQVVRLDRALGSFLDSLFRLRDPARVALVLTSDHGVTSIPEIARADEDPRPMRVDLGPLLEGVRARMHAARADTMALSVFESLVLVDRAALKKARLNADSLLDAYAEEARQSAGVLRVDRYRELIADSARDPVARRWAHQFPTDSRIEMIVTLRPGSVWWTGNVAVHMSPHDADTHVPLVFFGPAFRAGRHDEFVRTVDLAPTLAAMLGVKPTETLDGVVLRKALR